MSLAYDAPANDPGPANVSLDAEQALLGCVLVENEVLERIDPPLPPDAFAEPFHARLWSSMCGLISRRTLAEPIGLTERLRADPGFEALGGMGYLAELIDKAPAPHLAGHYGAIVGELSMRRNLEKVGREIVRAVAECVDIPAEQIAAHAERALVELDVAPTGNNLVNARASARLTLDEIEVEAELGRPKGAMTGLRCFDRRMRGLRPGWLVVLGGRPSMGKTALARAAAMGCARKNPTKLVPFFAVEMARRELDERTLSQLSWEAGDGIAYQDMHGDTLTPMERMRLRDLAEQVPDNFLIDDAPVLSVEYVRRRLKQLTRSGPVAAAFIDYLQIMQRPEARGRNDAAILGEMTAELKRTARELGVCIVLLSQINRGVETRDDKRPILSDLRESGAIEQDANAVLFTYREAYYTERAEPKADASGEKRLAWEMACEEQRHQLDVIAAKVRQGAVGTDHQLYYPGFDAIIDDPARKR